MMLGREIEKARRKFKKVTNKNSYDTKFRKNLLCNPQSTLKEIGIDVPEGIEIKIVEDTRELIHFILPPKLNDEITDSSLEYMDKIEKTLPVDSEFMGGETPPWRD
jgi:hypothetical protein